MLGVSLLATTPAEGANSSATAVRATAPVVTGALFAAAMSAFRKSNMSPPLGVAPLEPARPFEVDLRAGADLALATPNEGINLASVEELGQHTGYLYALRQVEDYLSGPVSTADFPQLARLGAWLGRLATRLAEEARLPLDTGSRLSPILVGPAEVRADGEGDGALTAYVDGLRAGWSHSSKVVENIPISSDSEIRARVKHHRKFHQERERSEPDPPSPPETWLTELTEAGRDDAFHRASAIVAERLGGVRRELRTALTTLRQANEAGPLRSCVGRLRDSHALMLQLSNAAFSHEWNPVRRRH